MTAAEVRTLFAYNRWANRRLLVASGLLSQGDFNRDMHASFGSLRGTLIHTLWVEGRTLQVWKDGSFVPEPDPEEYPNVAAIESAWELIEQEQQAFAGSLTDERLASTVEIKDKSYTLGELIQHTLNHSTYHRGQLALLLRQIGHAPPSTDFRLFLAEARDIGLEV